MIVLLVALLDIDLLFLNFCLFRKMNDSVGVCCSVLLSFHFVFFFKFWYGENKGVQLRCVFFRL